MTMNNNGHVYIDLDIEVTEAYKPKFEQEALRRGMTIESLLEASFDLFIAQNPRDGEDGS